ncbi:MAG: DUF2164 family protein [Acidobacteria bacterium]|nr:MAG: DUF2164 family protein [Acidobacteriota bacterium]REK08782.1 MAG: DUF2164 family protein [Acidobacteriota bacterium]
MADRDDSLLRLGEDQRRQLTASLQEVFEDEFDRALSDFQAERLLEIVVGLLGPSVYNRALTDARDYVASRLDDLEADLARHEALR